MSCYEEIIAEHKKYRAAYLNGNGSGFGPFEGLFTREDIFRECERFRKMKIPEGFTIKSKHVNMHGNGPLPLGQHVCAVAGGSAIKSIMGAIASATLGHFALSAGCNDNNDVDYFPICSPEEGLQTLLAFGEEVDTGLKTGDVTRTKNAVSFACHHQFILGTSRTLSELLFLFDLPPCSCAVYNGEVYCTPACLFSLIHDVIVFDHDMREAGYERRFMKYVVLKEFVGIIPDVQYHRIAMDILDKHEGFAALIFEQDSEGYDIATFYADSGNARFPNPKTCLTLDLTEDGTLEDLIAGKFDRECMREHVVQMNRRRREGCITANIEVPEYVRSPRIEEFIDTLHFDDLSKKFKTTVEMRQGAIDGMSKLQKENWYCTDRYKPCLLDEWLIPELSDIVYSYAYTSRTYHYGSPVPTNLDKLLTPDLDYEDDPDGCAAYKKASSAKALKRIKSIIEAPNSDTDSDED